LRLSLPCQTITTAVRPLLACGLERDPTASHVVEPRVRIGEWTSFATPGGGAALLGRGWSIPEEGGTWATGPRSTLRLSAEPRASGANLVMEAETQALVAPRKERTDIQISVGKHRVTPWQYAGEGAGVTRRIVCLREDIWRAGRPLEITFRNRDPRSPASLGLSGDARPLSFKVRRVRVREAEPGECPGSDQMG
jgi:hypothetical protein